MKKIFTAALTIFLIAGSLYADKPRKSLDSLLDKIVTNVISGFIPDDDSSEKNNAEDSQTPNYLVTESLTDISYSDDFLDFDSQTQSFSKDRDGVYKWTGSFVIDVANLLSKAQRLYLKKFLLDLNDSTTVQIAVLTVPTTDGENIHDFAMRHFDKWELGKKGVDNGAILTVAFQDRKLDIATGDGTEGVLTDILCANIINKILSPAFKDGHEGDGIITAVKNMAGIITSDETLVTISDTDSRTKNDASENSSGSKIKWWMIVIGIVLLLITILTNIGGGSHIHIGGGRSFRSGGGGFHRSGGGGRSSGGGASSSW